MGQRSRINAMSNYPFIEGVMNENLCCFFQFQGRPELLDPYEKVLKREVVVSNTNEENFRQAMAYHAYEKADILFLPAKQYGKESIKGDLLTSREAVSDIMAFVQKQ